MPRCCVDGMGGHALRRSTGHGHYARLELLRSQREARMGKQTVSEDAFEREMAGGALVDSWTGHGEAGR
jgi:hypothetical protein